MRGLSSNTTSRRGEETDCLWAYLGFRVHKHQVLTMIEDLMHKQRGLVDGVEVEGIKTTLAKGHIER